MVSTPTEVQPRKEYSPAQAAELLNITPHGVRRAITSGAIRARKMGPMWLIPGAEIIRYQASRPVPGRHRDAPCDDRIARRNRAFAAEVVATAARNGTAGAILTGLLPEPGLRRPR